MVGTCRGIFQPIRQPNRDWQCRLEVLYQLLVRGLGKFLAHSLTPFPSVWLAFEIIFVFFMFPETSGRTLEELTFREHHH